MPSRSRRERRLHVIAALVLASASIGASAVRAEEPAAVEPAPVEPAPVEPPNWRFKHDDKQVKVVVLAGSIGAWPKQPYAKELERLCSNVEVHNLSQVGQGAWALKQRFKQQVLGNRRLALKDPALEHWLVYGGGLNSVGSPKSTNKHMRDLFVLAHVNNVKVVALSVTPWGSQHDRRWRGAKALEHLRDTHEVVDYTLGRLTPEQAFGSYGRKRPGGLAAPWDPLELPEVAVDLYDSPLRDRNATPLDVEATKLALARDKQWRAEHAKLDETTRAAQLDADARVASEAVRWFLVPELRSFDHTHPNTEGHRIIAATMCPKLPASWGCSCEPAAK
jgi:hypothetical protein